MLERLLRFILLARLIIIIMVALAASESSSPVRSRRRRRRRRRHFGVLTSIFAAAAALFLLVASSSSSVPSAEALAAAKKAVIRVCQNQDCRKRWRKLSGLSGASLPETFRDLLLPSDDSSIRIEPSGCLSRCGEGPNVQVDVDDNASGASSSSSVVVFNGVNDVVEAAVAVLGSPPLDIDVPPKLLAAASLTEKALKGAYAEEGFSPVLFACLFASPRVPCVFSLAGGARVSMRERVPLPSYLDEARPVTCFLSSFGDGAGIPNFSPLQKYGCNIRVAGEFLFTSLDNFLGANCQAKIEIR